MATRIAFPVEIVTETSDISGASAAEWLPALDAADRALTALRGATAHRDAVSTVDDRPGSDASTHTIRDWVLDARRIIAREAPRIFSAVGQQDDVEGYFGCPAAIAADLNAIADRISALHDLNRDGGQRGRSWALPSTTAAVPVWTSRRAWLAQVQHTLSTEIGRAACTSRHTSAEVVLRHAAVYAAHADGQTGRGVTASRATIMTATEMSETADKRSRRVLRDLELLADGAVGRTLTTAEHLAASLHHGASQSRAASTLHLTTPPHLAHIQAPARARKNGSARRVSAVRTICTGRDPLSVNSSSRREEAVRSYSPNACERTRGRGRIHETAPRSLHLQRAAAELASRAPGLRSVTHIGSICQAIRAAGIDTTVWTGRDIAAALDADSRRRGWMWPTTIENPAALLAWRLRRISWTGLSPSAAAARAAELRASRQAEAEQARAEADARRASTDTRMQRMAEIAGILAARPARSKADQHTRHGARTAAHPTSPSSESPAAVRIDDPATARRADARAELAALRRR